MNIKELREYLGYGKPISRASFSRMYNIPVRTLEDWEYGKRVPPEYLLELLERVVKLDKEEGKVDNMNKNFREIVEKKDLPEGATYFSEEYERRGSKHIEWKNLYNEKIELIEQVRVKYTNAIEDLTRIVSEDNKDDTALLAYDLDDLGNGFYSVTSRESTMRELELIAESIQK